MKLVRKAILSALTGVPLVLAGSAWTAERVQVRVGAHAAFGRVAFDWPSPAGYEARIEGDRLIVKFERTLEVDLSTVSRGLEGYVRAATLGSDGRTVVLDLTGPFDLQTRTFGSVVAVDLKRQTAQQQPQAAEPAAPRQEAKSPAPEKGKAARVRMGEHDGFSRIVVDWPRPAQYRVDKKDGNLTLEIQGDEPIDLGRLTVDPPKGISGARSWERGGRRIIDLTIPQEARFRHYADGRSIVLDILTGKPTADEKVAGDGGRTTPASKPQVSGAGQPNIAGEKNFGATSTATPAKPAHQPRPLIPGPVTAKSAVAAMPESAEPAAGRGAQETLVVADNTARPPVAMATPGQDVLPVGIERIRGGLKLSFVWTHEVPAAVINRADVIWVVFGEAAKADFAKITPEYSDVMNLSEQIVVAGATVLRFGVRPGMAARVERDQAIWKVELQEAAARPLAGAIDVRPEPAALAGAQVMLPTADVSRPVSVQDPGVGDWLMFGLIREPSRGIPENRNFADFRLLRTAQGIAIVPKSDDVQLSNVVGGMAVVKPGGLALSDPAGDAKLAAAKADVQLYRSADSKYLYDFDAWRRDKDGGIIEVRQNLQGAITEAPVPGRNPARLELARFLLSHGFATESIAVLGRIEQQDAAAVDDPNLRALRGAALVIEGRYEEAADDLGHPSLEGRREVSLWRGLAAARQAKWSAARDEFANGVTALHSFPADMRVTFRLAWAEAAVSTGDTAAAKNHIEAADKDITKDLDRLTATLLRARADEGEGEFGKALEAYQKVAASSDRPTRVQAQAGSIRVQLAQGVLSRKDAIEAFEKLRYKWRGDDFELQLLQTLGKLYIEEADYRNGLETMRQSVTYYPDSPLAGKTAKLMGEEFSSLFLSEQAAAMSPVKALGLYYDFRELTPVGENGDVMISKLADRLVSVDLLGKAAQLLEHQVKYRLKGVEKAKVGARLAVIHLLDRNPQGAASALLESDVPGISEALIAERSHLMARSLTELNRLPEALAALQGRKEPEAAALRADVYWQWKKWQEAAAAFEDALGTRWQFDEPLDNVTRQRVMQQAISYSLANDRASLDRVRERYRPFFTGMPDEKSFQVITSRVNREGADFRELASTIAQINQLEAFMANYRDKLRKGQLSAIN